MPTPSSSHPTDPLSFTSSCPEDQPPQSPTPSDPASLPEVVVVIGGGGGDGWGGPSSAYDTNAAVEAETPASDVDTPTSRPSTSSDAGRQSPETEMEMDEPDAVEEDDEDDNAHKDTAEPDEGPIDETQEAASLASGKHPSEPERRRRRTLNQPGDSDATPVLSPVPGGDGVDMGYDWDEGDPLIGGDLFLHNRIIPTSPSPYLRPGSKFCGTQQSERQVYDVQVEIKHVDLAESFLCGYLRIQGLTEDHPTLTTYFEGEIIGPKYSFTTRHPSWGASERTDMTHWQKFAAFRPLAKAARKGGAVIRDVAQREHIFMRWKEHFLVPDHRVRTINGASFEGFYYICFNQVRGDITGIYFHSRSEKFQQLELKHVEDKGCFSAIEFR